MDQPLIAYLNSPQLVVNVQQFFGVKYNSGGKSRQQVNGQTPQQLKDDPESESPAKVTITNKFWYYLFLFGTELGDELFYATFIPFWLWNVDGQVGRRWVFVWAALMYIGQALKDILRCPRPQAPVVKLQQKWAVEYGLPSTHAMVGVSIPFSILIYTQERYIYSAPIGLAICVLWCAVVCLSRLYLGMHSVLDIIAGLALAIGLMIPLIPLVDRLDTWLLQTSYSPLVILAVSILLIKIYPNADKWTPTRGDTTLCVSVCAGIQAGAWVNYQLDYIRAAPLPPPYEIIWPSHAMLGTLLLRTVLGLCCVLATRAVGKSVSYAVACAILGRDKTELLKSQNSLENKQKILVDLCSKYSSCFLIGFAIQYLLPNVFKMLGICRPDFYTEV